MFDQRIGDIFSARIAGNFVNADTMSILAASRALASATDRSAILAELAQAGSLKVVAAMHDVGDGRVRFFG